MVPEPPRWLLLIHQLPPSPAYLRVKTARHLQKVGAVAIKDSVYVLPNSDAALESFTWVSREIAAGGGESSICESSFVAGTSNEAIRGSFEAARARDFAELSAEVRATLKSLGRARRIDEGRHASGEAALTRYRRRLSDIAELDFFDAPGREAALASIDALDKRLHGLPASAARPPAERRVRGAIWVTRKGVHVDRIASGWLIKRFVDPDATFKFVPPKGYAPAANELRFDMFEAEYTHEGDACTFEVLARRFGVTEAGVVAIGEVVHDIDVRDGKFGRPKTAGVERLVTGLALTVADDDARLALGSQIFEALYEAWRRRKT
jgi:hypothetical protein